MHKTHSHRQVNSVNCLVNYLELEHVCILDIHAHRCSKIKKMRLTHLFPSFSRGSNHVDSLIVHRSHYSVISKRTFVARRPTLIGVNHITSTCYKSFDEV